LLLHRRRSSSNRLPDLLRRRAASGRGPRSSLAPVRRLRPPPTPVGHRSPLAEAAPGPHARSEELARLEAALFIAREPLSTRRLAKLARLSDGTRARTLLRELAAIQDASGSAVRVEPIAGGFQLLTRAPFGPWVRRLLTTPAENRLSAAALETLAIVAYRQPVTRAEIEAIRGVGCEEMLRQLMERDLVAVGGRTEELGRPNVYQTTKHFLRAFGLSRIEDLPDIGPVTAHEPIAPPGPETTAAPSAERT
jgi:segregation and condensation protein B